jgi:hypothetical protein
MKKPTIDGYYWYREFPYFDWEPAKVVMDGSGTLWFATFNGLSFKVESTEDHKWNGECK